MSKAQILIVEDDAALREALTDTLELAGYVVDAAENGRQALEKLEDMEPPLVVSDVRMEGMTGHVLLRQIKQRHPHTTVLLMTAYGSIEKAVEAMRDGAVDYLVKPFEAEVLLNTVSRTFKPGPLKFGSKRMPRWAVVSDHFVAVEVVVR